MIPPTSIDGTDITGATIDGTDVTEITVDGDTVFTAGPTTEPVAYSNLVAWYPFDSATYGGTNADDVTALFNPGQSGDSTAYDGTVSGANYQSSNGVTDINAGANSGNFDFGGNNEVIELPSGAIDTTTSFTLTLWFNGGSGRGLLFNTNNDSAGFNLTYDNGQIVGTSDGGGTRFEDSGSLDFFADSPSFSTGTYVFVAISFSAGNTQAKAFIADGGLSFQNYSTISTDGSSSDPIGPTIGGRPPFDNLSFDGQIDDVRIYDTELGSTTIEDIYNNTKP